MSPSIRCCAIACLLCLHSALSAGEAWRNLTTANGLCGNEIQFLQQDAQGAVWIGTLAGLAVCRGGKLSVALERGDFWDLLQVGPRKYWIGASRGAVFLDGKTATTSLRGSTVAPIVRYDRDTVWALSKNLRTETSSLLENRGEGWKAVTHFEKQRVVNLYRTSDGTVWVAIDGNGLHAVHPTKGLGATVHHLEGFNVTALAEDSRKRVWAGLWGRGVAVLERGTWSRHLKQETSFIFALREDATGNLWVATSQSGLWCFDGKRWVSHLRDEGGINMLETTSDGRVWISSQAAGGLRCWQAGAWHVSLPGPLPIRCLLETRDKQLWAGGVLSGVYIKE